MTKIWTTLLAAVALLSFIHPVTAGGGNSTPYQISASPGGVPEFANKVPDPNYKAVLVLIFGSQDRALRDRVMRLLLEAQDYYGNALIVAEDNVSSADGEAAYHALSPPGSSDLTTGPVLLIMSKPYFQRVQMSKLPIRYASSSFPDRPVASITDADRVISWIQRAGKLIGVELQPDDPPSTAAQQAALNLPNPEGLDPTKCGFPVSAGRSGS